jgi:hypothetical protein
MKGFWRHIAASASITAVFLVCAVALAVSAAPVAAPPAQPPRGDLKLILSEPFTDFVEALSTDCAETPAPTPPAAAPKTEEAAQPDPATAAPARASRPPLLLAPGNPRLSALN